MLEISSFLFFSQMSYRHLAAHQNAVGNTFSRYSFEVSLYLNAWCYV